MHMLTLRDGSCRMRLRSTFCQLSVLVLAAMFCGQANATMQLGRNIIHFLPGEQPRIDVPVRNPDDETMYVEVDVLEVTNPGTEQEARTPVVDARRVDFLVTPNRFVLPPGGQV